MKPYGSRDRDAGVVAYDYGPNWIQLEFAGGKIYEYLKAKIGAANLRAMKRLADSGEGLTTFVNTNPRVKNGYLRE